MAFFPEQPEYAGNSKVIHSGF